MLVTHKKGKMRASLTQSSFRLFTTTFQMMWFAFSSTSSLSRITLSSNITAFSAALFPSLQAVKWIGEIILTSICFRLKCERRRRRAPVTSTGSFTVLTAVATFRTFRVFRLNLFNGWSEWQKNGPEIASQGERIWIVADSQKGDTHQIQHPFDPLPIYNSLKERVKWRKGESEMTRMCFVYRHSFCVTRLVMEKGMRESESRIKLKELLSNRSSSICSWVAKSERSRLCKSIFLENKGNIHNVHLFLHPSSPSFTDRSFPNSSLSPSTFNPSFRVDNPFFPPSSSSTSTNFYPFFAITQSRSPTHRLGHHFAALSQTKYMVYSLTNAHPSSRQHPSLSLPFLANILVGVVLDESWCVIVLLIFVQILYASNF